MTLDQIIAEALKLDLRARAALAQRLLHSLETLSESEISQLWAEEAERRDHEMDRDPSLGRPAEDVLKDIRSRFGK